MTPKSKIYGEALAIWGVDSQLDKAIEEAAELIVAIERWKQKRAGIRRIIEEAVDVAIMAEQIRDMIEPAIFDVIHAEKLQRLAAMIDIEKDRRAGEGVSG